MADIANGTQFSDLPSFLAIEILSRLPLKALLICSRCVCKDWIRSYFSDPYFIRLQLETSKTLILTTSRTQGGGGRNLRFDSIEDEVSTGNLRIETLELPCIKLQHDWCVANSCNGLLCFVDKSDDPDEPDEPDGSSGSSDDSSSVYVCNPILDEWVSIRVPVRTGFYHSRCALGFSAKDDQYKILQCMRVRGTYHPREYEWSIYTIGTGHWRRIETKEAVDPWGYSCGLGFNTSIHGSLLHWTSYSWEGPFVQSFDFETERFTAFSLPKLELESDHVDYIMWVTLGVINGCLWASFCDRDNEGNGEMWAMKERGGVDKPWTMMVAFTNDCDASIGEELQARNEELVIFKEDIGSHNLLFTLNGEMLTWHWGCHVSFVSYNLKTMRRRAVRLRGDCWYWNCFIAYNPSFVSLYDVAKGERVIRGRDLYERIEKRRD